jgi:Coenzyme PQQ synthesis protein D (PqqD)
MPRHLRISDAAVVRDLDGESVILNIESGIYFGLDRIGTRVWQLIEEHGDVDAIVRVMEHEYDVDPQTLRADAEALVAALIEKRLIIEGDA